MLGLYEISLFEKNLYLEKKTGDFWCICHIHIHKSDEKNVGTIWNISFWKEFVFREKNMGTLVCTSHTHTKIRRKKCGDLGLKPGGVMWGLYEISLFEKTLVSTSHTHTQIRRKKWGPNSSKQVPSTTVQFSHTHYLGPQIAPLTNTND